MCEGERHRAFLSPRCEGERHRASCPSHQGPHQQVSRASFCVESVDPERGSGVSSPPSRGTEASTKTQLWNTGATALSPSWALLLGQKRLHRGHISTLLRTLLGMALRLYCLGLAPCKQTGAWSREFPGDPRKQESISTGSTWVPTTGKFCCSWRLLRSPQDCLPGESEEEHFIGG